MYRLANNLPRLTINRTRSLLSRAVERLASSTLRCLLAPSRRARLDRLSAAHSRSRHLPNNEKEANVESCVVRSEGCRYRQAASQPAASCGALELPRTTGAEDLELVGLVKGVTRREKAG